jgi:hypothetical protein
VPPQLGIQEEHPISFFQHFSNPRSAGTEDMEPAEYEACIRTRIAKAMGFVEDTTNEAELSLVDSYYEIQLAVVNKLAQELRESMTFHMKHDHGLVSEEEFKAYQLSGRKEENNRN